MKAKNVIRRKMNRTADSDALALNLLRIISAVVLIFSTSVWSQTAEWTVYNTANSGLPYNGVTGLAINAQGTVWIGTGKWNAWAGGGLAKFNGQNWTVYNTSNSGLPNNDHTGLAVDEQGNVWSGTESGLGKFDGQNWTVYNTSNSGLRHNLVSTPSFDEQGNLWIGSYGGGLAKFDGANWMVYNTANSGLPHNRAWATIFDAQDRLWVGTLGGGLAMFDGVNWTVYNTSNSGLPHNNVPHLAIDAEENLWIGTDNGLAKFDTQSWSVYKTSNSGLPNNTIWALAVDAQDNIWIGTYGSGLAKFDGKNWTTYKTSNSGLPDNRIYCLTVDAQGNLWIGTENGGVAVYQIGEQLPIVDFNGDGLVNIKDLLRLIESWGQDDPSVDIAPPSGDGVIDVLDLQLLMSYWEQPIDDPTLIAHWAMDETEGAVAYDCVGLNDAFVLGKPRWNPDGGHVAGALEFDGLDDSISTPAVLNPSDGPFSVLAWVQGGMPGQVVISQFNGANWLATDTSSGCIMTQLSAPGRSGGPLQSEIVITDGAWHRVGFVWDGLYRSLYVDDTLVAEDSQNGLGGPIAGLNIGCGSYSAAGTFWSGMIDDVRIYNRVVSP